MKGNMLGNGNNKRNLGLDGLLDGGGGLVGGHVNSRGIWLEHLGGLGQCERSRLLFEQESVGVTLRTEGRSGKPRCSPSCHHPESVVSKKGRSMLKGVMKSTECCLHGRASRRLRCWSPTPTILSRWPWPADLESLESPILPDRAHWPHKKTYL